MIERLATYRVQAYSADGRELQNVTFADKVHMVDGIKMHETGIAKARKLFRGYSLNEHFPAGRLSVINEFGHEATLERYRH